MRRLLSNFIFPSDFAILVYGNLLTESSKKSRDLGPVLQVILGLTETKGKVVLASSLREWIVVPLSGYVYFAKDGWRTMTVIYFTKGELISDVHIRRSLIRIPEVLGALRKGQAEFLRWDLLQVMESDEQYQRLNFAEKYHLTQIIQEALFNRWHKGSVKYDLILRHRDHPRMQDLCDIFVKLSSLEKLRVIVIGPGLDTLEVHLRRRLGGKSMPLFEVIDLDPALSWFWSDFKSSMQWHS